MKLIKAIFLSAVMLGATFVNAATSRYEVQTPSTSAHYLFPGLDLNNIEKIVLTTSTTSANPDYSIDRMEVKFPNANDLVINNFKVEQGGHSFYATVNNGWVFRKLIVELDIPGAKPVSGESIYLNIYVANADYFNNNFAVPPQGDVYSLEVEFEDESGFRQTFPVGDLRTILDQAYQP
ncbi:MAG: hypothetical protein KZQ88_06400 [Candidatus Thiodiazotropha sp. (ex Dulcina madagascariensis)]|nr:hypothetical protein [Candidatus Thiodiazotropha sp. (ex Dulcina madagascariensis)]MCU7928557.1 hypothetical protein [Candidatus Thiodiazotropha sp. (ex Dulcina madagascariensis)]